MTYFSKKKHPLKDEDNRSIPGDHVCVQITHVSHRNLFKKNVI